MGHIYGSSPKQPVQGETPTNLRKLICVADPVNAGCFQLHVANAIAGPKISDTGYLSNVDLFKFVNG